MTPLLLNPSEYLRLLDYGIGLTDMVKGKAGMDHMLEKADFSSQPMAQKINRMEEHKPTQGM